MRNRQVVLVAVDILGQVRVAVARKFRTPINHSRPPIHEGLGIAEFGGADELEGFLQFGKLHRQGSTPPDRLEPGAAWVTRTPDLRITNAPLYRLS